MFCWDFRGVVARPDETGKDTHQDLWLLLSRLLDRCGRRRRSRCRSSRRRDRFFLRHDEHLVLVLVSQVGLFRTRRQRTAGGGRLLREGGGVLLPVFARALDEVCRGRELRRGRCESQRVLERGGGRDVRGQRKRARARERARHAPDEALRLSCWTGEGSTSMSRFGLRSCIVCCWRSVIPYVRVGGDASLSQMNETKDGILALLQPPLSNIYKSWTRFSASSPSPSSRTTRHQPRRRPPNCPRRRPSRSRRRPSPGSSDSMSSRLPLLDNRMPD